MEHFLIKAESTPKLIEQASELSEFWIRHVQLKHYAAQLERENARLKERLQLWVTKGGEV
jgi:hypothetical protein